MSILRNKLAAILLEYDGQDSIPMNSFIKLVNDINTIENLGDKSVNISGQNVTNKTFEQIVQEKANFNNTKVFEIYNLLDGLECQKADYILSLAKSNLKENSIVKVSSFFEITDYLNGGRKTI